MTKIFQKINAAVSSHTGYKFSKIEKEKTTDLVEILDTLRNRAFSEFTTVNESLRKFLIDNFLTSKAQLFQDLWVLWELNSRKDGFFVEFGAFDGQQLSNTFLLEKEYGWHGILSEPNPELHKSILECRSARLDHRCVLAVSGEVIKLLIAKEAEYSTVEKYAEADLHAALRIGSKIHTVPTVSLNDLLNENGAPPIIDYMSIDTEGSEFEILAAYDWSHHIRCLSIEHNFTKNESKIDNLLLKRGYIRRFQDFSKWDAWYVHHDDGKIGGRLP